MCSVDSRPCRYLTFEGYDKAGGDIDKEAWFSGVKNFVHIGGVPPFTGNTLFDLASGKRYWVVDSDGVNITDNLACST